MNEPNRKINVLQMELMPLSTQPGLGQLSKQIHARRFIMVFNFYLLLSIVSVLWFKKNEEEEAHARSWWPPSSWSSCEPGTWGWHVESCQSPASKFGTRLDVGRASSCHLLLPARTRFGRVVMVPGFPLVPCGEFVRCFMRFTGWPCKMVLGSGLSAKILRQLS